MPATDPAAGRAIWPLWQGIFVCCSCGEESSILLPIEPLWTLEAAAMLIPTGLSTLKRMRRRYAKKFCIGRCDIEASDLKLEDSIPCTLIGPDRHGTAVLGASHWWQPCASLLGIWLRQARHQALAPGSGSRLWRLAAMSQSVAPRRRRKLLHSPLCARSVSQFRSSIYRAVRRMCSFGRPGPQL